MTVRELMEILNNEDPDMTVVKSVYLMTTREYIKEECTEILVWNEGISIE